MILYHLKIFVIQYIRSSSYVHHTQENYLIQKIRLFIKINERNLISNVVLISNQNETEEDIMCRKIMKIIILDKHHSLKRISNYRISI
jgi:hypothetical protein